MPFDNEMSIVCCESNVSCTGALQIYEVAYEIYIDCHVGGIIFVMGASSAVCEILFVYLLPPILD